MSTDTLNAQLLSQLECPVCFETCVPPIYMCCNGHSVCAKCRAQLNECSTCRAPGRPKLRSVQLEKIAELVKLPCVNQLRGCKLTFNRDELVKHLPKCDHGFKCHLCNLWKGSVHGVKNHVLQKHTSSYLKFSSSGSKSILTRVHKKTDSYNRTHFFLCGFNEEIFWFAYRYTSDGVFSTALNVVSHGEKDTSHYYYSVVFKSNDPRSEHMVFHQADVLTEGAFSRDMDTLLPDSIIDSYQDGKIKYTLKISEKKM